MNNEEYFGTWLTHYRALNVFATCRKPERDFKTVTIYLYGPPGVGKSRLAMRLSRVLSESEPYYKSKGQWWDGYESNDVVVWDDYRGDCYDVQELLKLTDRYRYRVQFKDRFMNFTSKYIIFTSNKYSWELYKDGKGVPFQRRIDFNHYILNYDGELTRYITLEYPRMENGVNFPENFDIITRETSENYCNIIKEYIIM
jgi:DNA polymerase III delta prime subunit